MKHTDTPSAYARVMQARANTRPTALDYIEKIFPDFFELHGDRRFGDDPAVVGGLATLNGRPCTVIGIEKGHTAAQRTQHHFGAPSPEGYRKAQRLMHQAEKFSRPVVCLIDTSGAGCTMEAEQRGQGQAIAESLMIMSSLQTPILSIFIGEGGSGGALALAVADEVWMLENAIYSVVSPEGCASILWKDADRAAEAAQNLRLTAQDALELGVADAIIDERDLGSDAFYAALSKHITKKLDMLCQMPVRDLTARRYARFRAFGNCEKTEA